jgi:hypothetical protein
MSYEVFYFDLLRILKIIIFIYSSSSQAFPKTSFIILFMIQNYLIQSYFLNHQHLSLLRHKQEILIQVQLLIIIFLLELIKEDLIESQMLHNNLLINEIIQLHYNMHFYLQMKLIIHFHHQLNFLYLIHFIFD